MDSEKEIKKLIEQIYSLKKRIKELEEEDIFNKIGIKRVEESEIPNPWEPKIEPKIKSMEPWTFLQYVPKNCPKCGIIPSQVMHYGCSHPDCPTGFGPKGF